MKYDMANFTTMCDKVDDQMQLMFNDIIASCPSIFKTTRELNALATSVVKMCKFNNTQTIVLSTFTSRRSTDVRVIGMITPGRDMPGRLYHATNGSIDDAAVDELTIEVPRYSSEYVAMYQALSEEERATVSNPHVAESGEGIRCVVRIPKRELFSAVNNFCVYSNNLPLLAANMSPDVFLIVCPTDKDDVVDEYVFSVVFEAMLSIDESSPTYICIVYGKGSDMAMFVYNFIVPRLGRIVDQTTTSVTIRPTMRLSDSSVSQEDIKSWRKNT